jgi:hypothetical protein
MNDLAYLKDLAFKAGDNAQDQIALYISLLEAHIGSQNALLQVTQHELDQILIELSQEKS